jgi:hypothetical protein
LIEYQNRCIITCSLNTPDLCLLSSYEHLPNTEAARVHHSVNTHVPISSHLMNGVRKIRNEWVDIKCHGILTPHTMGLLGRTSNAGAADVTKIRSLAITWLEQRNVELNRECSKFNEDL